MRTPKYQKKHFIANSKVKISSCERLENKIELLNNADKFQLKLFSVKRFYQYRKCFFWKIKLLLENYKLRLLG